MTAAGGRRSDGGFTLVELVVTMALGAIVAASLGGLLVSQTNAEREVTLYSVNQEDVRQALVAIQRDLRSAEPLTEVSNPLDLRHRVDLRVYEDVTAPAPVRVRWRLDAATNELLRETLDEHESVVGVSHRLRGVVNEDIGRPLFTYYKADGAVYDLGAPGTTAYTVAYCTVRVRIDLRAKPNGGHSTVDVVSDVQLRNRLPGQEECPG